MFPSVQLRFQGLTHNVRGKHWLSYKTLDRALDFQKTDYLGSMPRPMLAVCPGDPRQTLAFFDDFANRVRKIQFDPDKIPPRELGKKGERTFFADDEKGSPLNIRYLGEGSFGQAFLVTIHDAPYVLKVFHEKGHPDYTPEHHGSFAENAAGVYLSKWHFRDLGRYYCGNPRIGWELNELITKDMSPATRRGIRMSDREVHADDFKNNNINDVGFEHGGLRNSFPLHTLDEKERKAYFDKLMATPGLRKRAAEQLWELPEKHRYEGFLQAMVFPACRDIAASHIGSLPKKHRAAACRQALSYPESRAMAKFNICELPLLEQPKALLLARQFERD